MENKTTTSDFRLVLLICGLLIASILIVYVQVKDYSFINYDDDLYVTKNRMVQKGLTTESVIWSLSTTDSYNWHPVTWLSHMLDVELFGLNAGWHHMSNVFFHILNTLLLFLLLKQMTGDLWPSALVAALFALHPLHVESVAWISERKDVLSTFFGFLTLLAYYWYVKYSKILSYAIMMFVFVLGLMAKPMLVTLPFVLLLLDYWPLSRFDTERIKVRPLSKKRVILKLLTEKTPLIILSAIFCGITLFAQKSAMVSLTIHSPIMRVTNAMVSYTDYLGNMICPVNLAIPYLYNTQLQWLRIVAAFFVMSSISFLVIARFKRNPYLIVGWLWFLVTLIPVIGLVQVGLQVRADRYTYVPLIGLFIILAWGGVDIVKTSELRKKGFVSLTVSILIIFILLSWQQVKYWENSETLFSHTIKVTKNNHMAHCNLGVALLKKGHIREAANEFLIALTISPNSKESYNGLGVIMATMKNYDKAIVYFRKAIKIDPNYIEAATNLQKALAEQKAARQS